jgi:hypothetical protein
MLGINMKRITMKKAIFYTMDALLASMLLIGAVMLIYSTYNFEDTAIEQQTFTSQDILTVLSELKVSELNQTLSKSNNTFINDEIISGAITDANISVLAQIGEYWALNQQNKSLTLLELVINDSIPKDQGMRVSMFDMVVNENLLERNSSRTNSSKKLNSISSNRMIAGIKQGAPVTGSSGTSSLKKIRNKKTSSYYYFGGFVGQGNISVNIDLPSDFNSSRLVNAQMKVDTPGTFTLLINLIPCGGTRTGNSTQISVWDLSACNGSLHPGSNAFVITYSSSLNTSYVSGGFIKVTYTTDTLLENSTQGHYRYYFPDINGFMNFYDTMSVQGNIANWTLNVTFFNPYQTFFTFGNETIFITQGNSTTNQNIIYSRHGPTLPQEPIPLRLAVTNFSNITTTIYGLPADTFIVTDTSGSMDDCIGTALNCSYEYRKTNGGVYIPISCVVLVASACDATPDNPCGGAPFNRGRNYVTACNQSKMGVAKQVDNNFVNTIFNASTLHRIGLVDYDTRSNSLTPLNSTALILHNAINAYAGGGNTCTCCGINRARNNLTSSTNPKFMIILSDGDANICCTSLNDITGTGSSGGCGAGANNPLNWSILAGQTACANNITVFTIGFGTGMSASGKYAMQKTACNDSLYYNATDTVQLQAVFDNITQQILLAANFSSQTVTVSGNFTPSRLYGSSYIDVDYTPLSESSLQNKISVVTETSQFNGCNASVYIPANIEIQDAHVTSYSGSHWTKQLIVNGNTVFNLTKYGADYLLLGDPFVIQIPSVYLIPGINNSISLSVGDSPSNSSTCSNNNTLIYTALVDASTERTDALEYAVGCNWTIETSSGSTFNLIMPNTAPVNKTCYYTSAYMNNHSLYPNATQYDLLLNDVYDVAVYNLLKQLDYEHNGKIFFDLTHNDLEIILTATDRVAYMWGPS